LEISASAPSVSVVVVCDYAAGTPEGWEASRKSLKALAAQDFAEKAEFILCESDEFQDQLPADLTGLLPGLRILFVRGKSSYELKNAAVEAASGDLIAMIDADCVPRTDWLRLLVDSLRKYPRAAAVSGKTTYSGNSLSVRMNCLLGRAFVDPGGAGLTQLISDNNAGFRRSAYLAHPLPLHVAGFTGFMQSREMLRQGYELYFDAGIGVEHEFEGWSMEADIRRNRGHAAIKTRLLDRSLPYAWAARLGPLGMAPMLASKILNSWRDCLRCGPAYGIRWYEVPLVMMGSVGVSLLEAPGMLAAFQGRGLTGTHFR
jgi:hypothetical protein